MTIRSLSLVTREYGLNVSTIKFTKTQRAILDVLSDGGPHPREELRQCLDDELASLAAMRVHLSELRKLLRPQGQDIICELRHRKTHYRHVRLLKPYAVTVKGNGRTT